MTKIQTLKKLISVVKVGNEEEEEKWVLRSNDLGVSVKGVDLHRFVFEKLPDLTDEKKTEFEALATKVQKDDKIFLNTSEDHSGGIIENKESILNSLFNALHSTRKDRNLDAEVPNKSYTHSQSGICYKSRIAIGDNETRKTHKAHLVDEKGKESLARGLSAVKNGCSRSFESFKQKMSRRQVNLPYYDREQGYHFNHIKHRVTGEHFVLPESEHDWNEFHRSHPNSTTWSTADDCRPYDFCMPYHTENNTDIVDSPTETLTCPTLRIGSKRIALVTSSSESTIESTEPTSNKKAKTGYLYVHNLAFSKKHTAVLASADAVCGMELHEPLTKSAKIGFTDRNINASLTDYKGSSSIPQHQKFLTINTVNAHQKEQEVLNRERKSGNVLRGEWVHMRKRKNREDIVAVDVEIGQVDKKDRKRDIKKDHRYEPKQMRGFIYIYGADLLRWIDIGICDLDTIVQKIKDGHVRIWTE